MSHKSLPYESFFLPVKPHMFEDFFSKTQAEKAKKYREDIENNT